MIFMILLPNQIPRVLLKGYQIGIPMSFWTMKTNCGMALVDMALSLCATVGIFPM